LFSYRERHLTVSLADLFALGECYDLAIAALTVHFGDPRVTTAHLDGAAAAAGTYDFGTTKGQTGDETRLGEECWGREGETGARNSDNSKRIRSRHTAAPTSTPPILLGHCWPHAPFVLSSS
jgi:hypothetical protein